ncbi:MAG: hypothetical protein ACK4OP_06735 [Gemmobacter sp.]
MRLIALPLLVALGACAQPPVPDSGAGVGFGSYTEYLRDREAQLRGAPPAAAPFPAGPAAAAPAVVSAPLGTPLPPAAAAPVPPAGPGRATISDEQDFGAVASRESIESDAERRRAQQAQLVVVAPTAVPVRTGPSGPNVVEYALTTRHDPGTRLYSRFPIRMRSPEAACAAYASDDLAQEAFLAAGGPERDPRGLDPDGDGFACRWDPRPFRAAVQ